MDSNTKYIDTCNQGIFNTLTKLSQDGMQFLNFNPSDHRFRYLISPDKKFCLISWMPDVGGTWHDYTNVAIYNTGKQVRIKWLRDSALDVRYDSDINYDTIATIHTHDGRAIYLAYGYGQGQGTLPWRSLAAFTIKDSLEDADIFPEGDPIFLEYMLYNFSEKDDLLEVQFRNKGKELLIPVLNRKEVPLGYQKLIFDGERYKKAGFIPIKKIHVL